MKIFRLLRVSQTKEGTFGVLMDDYTRPFALTLEPPWLHNKTDDSCIPPGDYICTRIISPKFGETFEIISVPGRSHVLFHKGNVAVDGPSHGRDTHGCVLLGEQFNPVLGGYGITHSGEAFQEFMGLLKGVSQFRLEIEVSSLIIDLYSLHQ